MSLVAALGPMQSSPEFHGPYVNWWSLTPLLILLGTALIVLVGGALTPRGWARGLYAGLTVAGGVAAIIVMGFLWDDVIDYGSKSLVGDELVLDGVSLFLGITICIAVILAALVTDSYLRREDLDGPEVYGLYLLSALGGLVMVAANDLIVLFLGLETLSIALYVLAASHRKRMESQEAGIKYFVLGGFSSAFFLYGIALVYGATGTTRLRGEVSIKNALTTAIELDKERALLLGGIALLLVGLGFKIAAVPFHTWTPDVYEGSPSPITGFMASAAKVAAFGGLLRAIVLAMPEASDDWRPVIWALAVLTLVVASVLAVVQTNVKRMLAYSSISHAGFILVGVEASAHISDTDRRGLSSVLFYLITYAVLVSGTFAVVTLIGRTGDAAHDLDSYSGLGRRRPLLAMALTVLLLAQAGVPLTSGFVAKFGVITAAASVHSYALAVIAMLAAAIAAYLYLRIIVSMFFEEHDEQGERVAAPVGTSIAVFVSVAFTLLVGFFPNWLLDLAQDAGIARLLMRDWILWHKAYEDPDSFLSKRRETVTRCVEGALDDVAPGPIRLLSLCAGEGRDVLDAATGHPRAGDLAGVLVELDEEIAARATTAVGATALALTVRCADAGDTATFADVLPVDVLLLVGIFGNIVEDDIHTTVRAAPAMCRDGGTVIWTRGRWEPDFTPTIREWFAEVGCESLAFISPGPGHWSVGVERVHHRGPAEQLPQQLFTFAVEPPAR